MIFDSVLPSKREAALRRAKAKGLKE